MNRDAESDPFEHTKMTFGEHLEELRGALLRSVFGIVVGVLVALPVAPTVVRWIEWPLKKALRTHYLESAKDKIDQSSASSDALERVGQDAAVRWSGIDEFGMIPERLFLDRAELLEQLEPKTSHPDRELTPTIKSFDYQPEELRTAGCRTMAKTLVDHGNEKENSPEKAVWRQLSTSLRESLVRISQTKEPTPADRGQVANALNAAIASPALHQDNAFEALNRLFDGRRLELITSLRDNVAAHFTAQGSRSLNRQLLDALFGDHLRAYRPSLLEVTVWRPVEINVQALSVHEPFMIYIKAALIVGFILASPWVFIQIWTFVAAGLYSHEKLFVHRFLPFSIGLFLAGASLAFFFVFEPVLDFLFQFNRRLGISAEPRITDWLSFVMLLPIGFGISFQLPLVMMFLERIGIMSVKRYLDNWRIAVLIIFVLSMLLTPADPISMLLMAIPLTALYFGGIVLCRSFPHTGSTAANAVQ